MEGGHVNAATSKRTITRTGIDWDNFFRLAGMRAVYTMQDCFMESAISAASYRGYKTETLCNGDGTSVMLIKRERETDIILTDLMALPEKQLRAVYNAAIEAGLIKPYEGGSR
jgi:hypothetical protein